MGSGFCLAIRFIILLKYRTPRADLPHLAEQRWEPEGALQAGEGKPAATAAIKSIYPDKIVE